jgi:hypothetical protein
LYDGGLFNPSAYHQRFRRNEYREDSPFFQWWFFSVMDTTNHVYYDLSYSLLFSPTNSDPSSNSSGIYMGFARNDPGNTANNVRQADHLPIGAFSYKNFYDLAFDHQYPTTLDQGKYTLEAMDDDHYRLKGDMYFGVNGTVGSCWRPLVEGKCHHVRWNIHIMREWGWFGEAAPTSLPAVLSGLIAWNPYGHRSYIDPAFDSFIEIDGHVINLSSPQFAVYCDMNWGSHMPQPKPDIAPRSYPWDWYAMNAQNTSLVCGLGLTYDEFFAHGSWAMLCSFYHASGWHAGFRQVRIEDEDNGHDGGGGDGGLVVFTGSDEGEIHRMDVVRSQWTNISDSSGVFEIPLVHELHVDTALHNITLTVTTKPNNYLRLLFPFEYDGLDAFSDFAGMGVQMHLLVTDAKTGRIFLEDESSAATGVEFAYFADL